MDLVFRAIPPGKDMACKEREQSKMSPQNFNLLIAKLHFLHGTYVLRLRVDSGDGGHRKKSLTFLQNYALHSRSILK